MLYDDNDEHDDAGEKNQPLTLALVPLPCRHNTRILQAALLIGLEGGEEDDQGKGNERVVNKRCGGTMRYGS